MAPKLDPKDEQVLATATALIDQCSYREAHALLNTRIAQGVAVDDPAGIMLLGEMAGHLIDLGSEGRIERAINDGLALLEHNREYLTRLVTGASLDYNIGNAKSALVDLRTPHAFKTPGLADQDLLVAAKNHYWKAIKAHTENDNFAQRLRTNLGNALRKSGRIAEALLAYDEVIAYNPSFTMAHFHRALALLTLERQSGRRTTRLLREAEAGYAFTVNASGATAAVREVALKMHQYVAKRLKASGYSGEPLAREIQETQRKAFRHSAYRQFTLRHHLGLSEHSLYCHCNAARRDDLMIATAGTPITGDKIPRLELILNRLKAEYVTARHLYHQATSDHSTDLHEQEITYTELFEGETIGIRTSCYARASDSALEFLTK